MGIEVSDGWAGGVEGLGCVGAGGLAGRVGDDGGDGGGGCSDDAPAGAFAVAGSWARGGGLADCGREGRDAGLCGGGWSEGGVRGAGVDCFDCGDAVENGRSVTVGGVVDGSLVAAWVRGIQPPGAASADDGECEGTLGGGNS